MKKFIIKILFYFIPFICVYGFYKFLTNNMSGDIGNLGKIAFGKSYNKNLKKNYLSDYLVKDTLIVSFEKFRPTSRIFTIGDSFSLQGIFGYQNYLAHLLGDSVINIQKNEGNFATAISLLNSGIIDSSNCKILILEQVDRDLIGVLSNLNFELQYEIPQKKTKKENNNNADLYDLCSWIRLQFDYETPIFQHDLKQEYFTHNSFSHKLFYYIEDFNFQQTKPENIEKAKENLMLLNNKLLEKGIKMIFLIAADKYDVYRPFTADNSLPIDTTTDEFSNLPNICVINTKPILIEMVRNGEKDIYMVNDTHWSYKASEAVAEEIARKIELLGLLKKE